MVVINSNYKKNVVVPLVAKEDFFFYYHSIYLIKGKTVPLPASSDPEGSQEVKVPRFHDNRAGWW
jgi:hypothetical protein